MLQPVQTRSRRNARAARFGIIASKYNSRYVEGMVREARSVLGKAQAAVEVVRVPGAFEIPVVAARLASGAGGPFAALICLGVILRGETTHAQHIGEAVSAALAQIQIAHEVPVIHEVLLLENVEQARKRCLSPEHNRGAEAAHTALEMARIMASLGKRTGLRRVGRMNKGGANQL